MTEFVNPPTPQGSRVVKYMTAVLLAELDARPGEWALPFAGVDPRVRTSVGQWAQRHSEYEMTSRSSGKGVDVYVRRVSA